MAEMGVQEVDKVCRVLRDQGIDASKDLDTLDSVYKTEMEEALKNAGTKMGDRAKVRDAIQNL